MIRNNDEYMLADGSPRYGIRIGNGLVDDEEEPTAEPAPVSTGDLAERAASFTAHQLSVAGALRFTVRNNTAGEKALRDLRTSRTTEYAEAVAAVTEQLESPKAWRQAAVRTARRAVAESERTRGVARTTMNAMLLRLGLSLLPIVAVALLFAANVGFWQAFLVGFALSLACDPVHAHVRRRTLGPDNARVDLPTVSVLWDDVVDATFINILEAKGIGVNPFDYKAATAGWVHLARTADSVGTITGA